MILYKKINLLFIAKRSYVAAKLNFSSFNVYTHTQFDLIHTYIEFFIFHENRHDEKWSEKYVFNEIEKKKSKNPLTFK